MIMLGKTLMLLHNIFDLYVQHLHQILLYHLEACWHYDRGLHSIRKQIFRLFREKFLCLKYIMKTHFLFLMLHLYD